MIWTNELPKVSGWYWQRRNKYKMENIYYVFHFDKIAYCRRSGDSLFDKETVAEVGGEWFGPLEPPND